MTGDMPKTPGKIMMNAWPGVSDPNNENQVIDWLKKYDGHTPISAHYQWATYKMANGAIKPSTLKELEAGGGQTQQPTNPPQQPTDPPQQPSNGIKDYGTPMNANAQMVSDFRKNAGDFFASDGWTNGSVFDCWWHKSNTSLENGMLTLTIDQDKGGKGMYSGAEYRTNKFYSYGYYEVSMQAIKNDGVVSSFFTYTGESDNNPWDEIDIEVLGKDTTKVQLNYYRNGQGGHEFMYDLGFDASEGFHTYGFDWQPDHITWYVDGKEAHTMWGDVPKTAGKIMMNAWPGVSDPSKDPNTIEWLKPFNGKTPLSAHYQWVTYNPSR
jgi:beta-glucanase (GH16 family)